MSAPLPPVAPPPPAPARPGPTRPTRLQRLVAPPPTGWASVLGLGLMLAVAGLAMDQPNIPGPSPRGESQTAFLPIAMVLGGLVGAVLGRTRLPSTLAHLLGATIGVGVLLIAWGAAVSDEATLAAQLQDVSEKAGHVFTSVILERGQTQETIGFLIVIGAIAWTTGQFAAYNLVRRGMVAPAIVAVGTVVLIIALSPLTTPTEIYPYLVVVTGLALFLILRANLAHQQASWRRRHIVGGSGVGRAFLRGGAVVALVALMGASLLGVNAAASPLADTLTNVDQRVLDMAQWLNALFGGMGSTTNIGAGDFGDSARIEDSWEQSDKPLFTVIVDDDQPHYWRGGTYPRFDGRLWTRDATLPQAIDVAAGEELLVASDDGALAAGVGRRTVTFDVTSLRLWRTLLAPADPASVSLPSTVILDGQGGPLRRIELRDRLQPGSQYQVTSLVPTEGDDENGLTQARLAAAGTEYPVWATRYTDVQPGTLGGGLAAANKVIERLDKDERDPFHIALALESWFAGKGSEYKNDKWDFRYATDIADQCRPGQGVVDCLLEIRKGFCQHYATAMTLMLRAKGIPARYVQGYLPGERTGEGQWTVPISAAHAWVEVLFPGYGWVRFDPTPGNLENQSQSDLPVGDPVALPSPDPSGGPQPSEVPSFEPTFTPEPIPSEPPAGGGITTPDDAGPPLPLLLALLLALLLLIAVVVVVLLLRRVPGRDADALYRAIAALATRLGRGPRPAQTAYEFTASLSRAVPGVSDDLQAVAQAKVESQYGRRDASDGFAALLVSFRRVRRALYGLFIRRTRG